MNKKTNKLYFLKSCFFLVNNRGSSVIEMCFVMPIVIVVVFVVINMMLTQINKSIVLGRMYQTTYNKESYIANSSGNTDAEEALENSLEENLTSELSFADNISVNVAINSGKTNVLNIIPGNLQTEIGFDENNIGIFLILDSGYSSNELQVNEEIRDTGNNLRRWQLYGKIL